MAKGKAKDREVEHVRQAIASFGFSITTHLKRIFVIWPEAEEIFICKKLPRMGFWELSRVNRALWEVHGALGIVVFEYISVNELIKWFYDLALQTPAIIEGLEIEAEAMETLKKHSARVRWRDLPKNPKLKKQQAIRRKRIKQLQEAENRARERQDRISQTGRKTGRRQS